MITIPAITVPDPAGGGDILAPASPLPADALAVVCDDTKYTVYQPGDTVPVIPL
ncbi:hypothetical protein NUJ30_08810 [Burkholderia contaminans]|uniref:hypothetical protein n=1 Tax=Burkholderia contaminans TaxID=488447 RepID=UPI001748BF88|nr:hypothetical protein [Burkholderia contaminans]MBD1412784.1 hypothetical protein [Burkholderia contaminans]UXZ68764.1 hypothetical protein NUJ29_08815 [Burkholderia contaminans]UXZ76525.1 hypothetical protein NUJ30_08810 [Burkholderia contaminans]